MLGSKFAAALASASVTDVTGTIPTAASSLYGSGGAVIMLVRRMG
jgi:hypothetical protein